MAAGAKSSLLDDLARSLGPLRLPGSDLSALAEAISRRVPPAVRINRLAGCTVKDLPFRVASVPWLPDWGFWLEQESSAARQVHFGAGLYYVQDAGSMLAIRLCLGRTGRAVCDLCASPGGKATALTELLADGRWLLANEAVRDRLPALAVNMARWGCFRYIATNLDPEDLADLLPGRFDLVLADVPCTGQSLLGRGRQRLSAFDPRLIEHSAARQRRILRAAASLVRPGGCLVYSTCTFSWAENEGQVEWFVDTFRDFAIDPEPALSCWQSPEPAPEGCYRLWPHRDGCAGAFAVRFRRLEGDSGEAAAGACRTHTAVRAGLGRRGGAGRSRRSDATLSAKALREVPFDEWGRWRKQVQFLQVRDGRLMALPQDVPGWVVDLVNLGLVAFGPAAAIRIGRTWQPAYDLAMRRDAAFEPRSTYELTDDAAETYLRGRAVPCGGSGWTVAVWRRWPLGWMIAGKRQATNKLPKAARLNI